MPWRALLRQVANDLLSATMETVIEAVCEGNKVMLVGFGSFAPKHLPAREGRNPRTGEKLQIQGTALQPGGGLQGGGSW